MITKNWTRHMEQSIMRKSIRNIKEDQIFRNYDIIVHPRFTPLSYTLLDCRTKKNLVGRKSSTWSSYSVGGLSSRIFY